MDDHKDSMDVSEKRKSSGLLSSDEIARHRLGID
jgi:hypothetical protein